VPAGDPASTVVVVRRMLVVVAMLVGLVPLAGCSSPTPRKLTVALCPGGKLPVTRTTVVNGTWGPTVPAPCSTTTTTTTLPSPLPLGTSATLSFDSGTGATAGARVVVDRIWTDATPQLSPASAQALPAGWTMADAENRLLAGTGLSAAQVTWMGVELSVATTGSAGIEPSCGGRTGPPCLAFVAHGTGAGAAALTELVGTGWVFGVPGCPYPWSTEDEMAPGTSVSGCVAIAVPVDTTVDAVGMDLTTGSGFAPHDVALWQA